MTEDSIQFLIEQKVSYVNSTVNVCMLWWVSSIAFSGYILAAVWSKQEKLKESLRNLGGLGFILSVFFVAITIFGILVSYRLGIVQDEIADLATRLDPPQNDFFETEVTTFQITMWIGAGSFMLAWATWLCLWGVLMKEGGFHFAMILTWIRNLRTMHILVFAAVIGACVLVSLILYNLGLLFACSNDDDHTTATTIIPPPAIATPAPSPTVAEVETVPITPSKFSFEDGTMKWQVENQEASKAWLQVAQSDEMAKDGKYSLKIQTDLTGGETPKSKGEIWINMKKNPPSGVQVPLNLRDRTVSAWVYAPPGAEGDSSKPNGLQLFVKDTNWKAEYGTWQDVVGGQWNKIALIVGSSAPEAGHIDPGFNPDQIIAIGLKIGAGGGSQAKYKGYIYLDAVGW